MRFFSTNYTLVLLLLSTLTFAQNKVWTIEECVAYAVENNLQVQQSELQLDISKNNRDIAQWDYSPNLNFSSNYGWNFGLNIDPVTNQISQNKRKTASLGLSSNWVLFNGLRKYNSVSRSNLDYMAAKYGLEDIKNDIKLNVAGAFLDVLLNKEILAVAFEQERITELQLDRTVKLVEAGAQPKGNQFQLEAQLARDHQNRITAENAVVIGKLQLANLLQLQNPDVFDVDKPDLEISGTELLVMSPSAIFAEAVNKQPGVKSAEKNLESSKVNEKINKSGWMPTLSLNGQIGTSYSDQIVQASGVQTITTPAAYYDQNGIVQFQPVSQDVPTGVKDKPVGDQFADNLNEYVGLSLNVPIFNRMSVKNNVQNARINKDIAALQLEQEKNSLRQTIYQAHADAKASYNSYLAARKSVASNEESYKYSEERYNVGALNQFDYENAKNNLAIAKSEMIRAKYDCIFKIKVLEFYLTNQVKL